MADLVPHNYLSGMKLVMSCYTVTGKWITLALRKPEQSHRFVLLFLISLAHQYHPCSFSPSSGSTPGPVFDASRNIFHSRLKTFLFSIFPSIGVYTMLRLISWNLTSRCLAVTGGGSVGKRNRSSQPIIVIVIYILIY